ncbi:REPRODUCTIVE MERISTEM 39, REDUCED VERNALIZATION RESPONSE 1 [Hibiscus trionum]|uniref:REPRODUCTIVE MERISTEM 39, REDUCED VERNALIZATION RESPONSE 1 n=1 Tax=Hibiscus trionum TaxID=183268 RepID=A0A9W7M3E1_HIBTR|nr:REPRODUCTIVE MERISTEM 39, REDUCED VERNALIZATION RESPONSE 1 [Hibiscus trionum]
MSQPVTPSLPEKKSCIFYKLMVASNLQDKKLKIPNKFVKKFGDELSSIAMLTVPGGRLWLVELRKENKRAWLDSGWTVFLEYYSICIGYFLVFKYEGNSRFNVQIYNLKASEITYQSNRLNNSHEPCHDKCLKDLEVSDFDGITDSQPASSSSYFLIDNDFDECLDHDRKKCKNCTCLDQKNNVDDLRATFQSTRDKGIQFSGVEVTTAADEGGPYFLSGTQTNTKEIKQEIEPGKFNVKEELPTMNSPGIVHRRRGDVTAEGKQVALRAAAMFKPDNPFCRIILRPSYVYKGIFLHVPRCFALRYLNGVDGIITLQASNGKRWPVRCIYGQSSWKFSKGWAEFVLDNNLDEGDVCVFELISTNEIVLKVTIFRVLEDGIAGNQL